MAKFHGVIGYVRTEETAPGVYTEVITEYSYTGDIIRSARRWEDPNRLNENLNITNQISIIADIFAMQNFQTMRYIKWNGVSWKISNIDIQRPRLILTVGGVYNGPTN